MAGRYKYRWKSHVTPQEYSNLNSKWYRDSSVNKAIVGDCTHESSTEPQLTENQLLFANGASPFIVTGSHKIVYIKNTGAHDILISINGNYADAYRIRVGSGETFTTATNQNTSIYVKTATAYGGQINWIRGN